MSCRSTACSSVATSYARAMTDLADGQIQSLFHALKRQGKEQGVSDPTNSEYLAGLDRLAMMVRNDESIDEIPRERMLGRIDQARQEPALDGPAWFAVQQIHASASIASASLASVYSKVSASFGGDADRIRSAVSSWMYSEADSFEDVLVPNSAFRYDLTPGVPSDDRTAKALRKLGYEHFLTQPYPVFVYGTLRPGQGNYVVMGDAPVASVRAVLSGHAIYGAHRGFPYAVEHEDPSAITVGDLVWLSDSDSGLQARDNMDGLEGFHSDAPSRSHYERVLRQVSVTDAQGAVERVTAWTYMARGSARSQLRESERILEGDWVAARTQYRAPRPYFDSPIS